MLDAAAEAMVSSCFVPALCSSIRMCPVAPEVSLGTIQTISNRYLLLVDPLGVETIFGGKSEHQYGIWRLLCTDNLQRADVCRFLLFNVF